MAGPEIDEKLLHDFTEDDGVDIVVAKFLKVYTLHPSHSFGLSMFP